MLPAIATALRYEELQCNAVPPLAITVTTVELYTSDVSRTSIGRPTSVQRQTSVHKLLSDVGLPSTNFRRTSIDVCRIFIGRPSTSVGLPSNVHPQTFVERPLDFRRTFVRRSYVLRPAPYPLTSYVL